MVLPAQVRNARSSRHLGGASNYIAEYIIMLSSLVALTTSVILMLFSVFTLLNGETASLSTGSALSAVVAFLVFGPVYYVLSSRVRAEEVKNPSIVAHKARTVFYVLATISAFSWFTGFVVTSIYYLLSPLAVKGASYGDDIVTVFIPAVLSAGVIAASYISIAKSASATYVAKFTKLVLLVGLILSIATLAVAASKKDAKPSLKSGDECTYTNYRADKCSYDDYKQYLQKSYTDDYPPTTDYNRYNTNTENTLDSLYEL